MSKIVKRARDGKRYGSMILVSQRTKKERGETEVGGVII